MSKSLPDPVAMALIEKHGEFLSGAPLRQAMGYRSKRTFYRAVESDTTPVQVFKLPGTNMWVAKTRDVSAWLAQIGKSPPNKPTKK